VGKIHLHILTALPHFKRPALISLCIVVTPNEILSAGNCILKVQGLNLCWPCQSWGVSVFIQFLWSM